MITPSWFLDELAHVGSEHLEPTYVQGYDQKAGFDPARISLRSNAMVSLIVRRWLILEQGPARLPWLRPELFRG